MKDSNTSTVKNFGYGYLAGMMGIIASHPIDTLKTQYQQFNRLVFKNLYKGIIPPIIGVGLEKAVVFGVYESTIKHTQSDIVSGGLAGLSASIVVTPFERLKILLQTGQNLNGLKNINLFQGLSATLTRETPGFAIYFSVYNKLKYSNEDVTDIHPIKSFGYGALAGTAAWTFIYPQDRIKTIIQSADNNQKLDIKSIIKKTYEVGRTNNLKNTNSVNQIIYGIKHFYSGFSFAIVRAIFLHSGTFCMMEILNK